MKAKYLASAAILLLCAGAVALFLRYFERYSEEADRGWGAQARRNPYLAAEQFLAASGHRSSRADNLSVLDRLSGNDTLFLTSSSQVYNRERARALLDWVERGGHAIVVARAGGEDERDWLLNELGARVVDGNGDSNFDNPLRQLLGDGDQDLEGKSASEILREYNRKLREREAETDNADKRSDKPEPPRDPQVDDSRLVQLTDDSGADYRIYFNPTHLLWHPALNSDDDAQPAAADSAPVFWALIDGEDAGVPFMQFERGEGLITLMADAGLWQSDRIGHFDNAYLLTQLASDGDFVLLTRPQFDSLLQLARRYAAEFFLAGGLALLAWLLLRTQRFGPRAAAPETARRSLLEHLSACGHYYWRAERAGRLVRSYRARLLRRLGGDSSIAGVRRKLCIQLHEQTGLDESLIAACLWGDLPRDEEAFTEQMRNLQQIEAAL